MAWHTGTANGYKDLLAQIIAAAVADGWTQEEYITGEAPLVDKGYSGTMDEAVLKGPGFGQGFEVYVGIRSAEVAQSNIYALGFYGMTGYNPTAIFDQQPGISAPVFLNTWSTPINYWISVSDRRILVIAKCSNSYHSAYVGYILPFSSPVEFPCPYYVAADSAEPLPFGNTDTNTRGASAPGLGGGYFREPGGKWQDCNVYNSATSIPGFQPWDGAHYTLYPYSGTCAGGADGNGVNPQLPLDAAFEPLSTHPNSMPMMPIYVQALFDKGGFMGTLENVYWIPGNTFSPEQPITVGADNYLAFIQITRSYEQPSPYYAVKEA